MRNKSPIIIDRGITCFSLEGVYIIGGLSKWFKCFLFTCNGIVALAGNHILFYSGIYVCDRS